MKLRFVCGTASRQALQCAMAKREEEKIRVSLYGAFMRGTFDGDSTTWLNAISTRRRLWKNFPRLMAYRLSLNSSAVNERRGGAYTINRTKAAIAFSIRRIIPPLSLPSPPPDEGIAFMRCTICIHVADVNILVRSCAPFPPHRKCILANVCTLEAALIHTVVELQSFRERKSDN